MNFPKNILLVEDDKDDQELFISALSEINDVILLNVASNGKEALDKLQNTASLPSLIFIDVNMPIMNGLEFLSAIARDSKISDIPVVMLSSSTHRRDEAARLGAKAFIEKPTSSSLLRQALERTLHGILPV